MKQFILIFALLICVGFSSFGQETPIELIQEARVLVKDSAETVENPKALVQEAEALLKSLKTLDKQDRQNKKSKREGKSYKFQVGLTIQPLNFKNYGDEDKSGGAKLIKANGFNGFALGLTFRKAFTRHFALKSELTYSKQNEKSEFSRASYGRLGEEPTYLYNGKGSIDYTLFKIPVLADYSLNLDSKNTWFLHLNAGVQMIYLKGYKASHKTYFVSLNNEVFEIEDAVQEEFIDESGTVYRSTWEKISGVPVFINTTKMWEDKSVFKTTSLEFVAGFEIEKHLGDKFSIGFGGRYEQNLSEAQEKDRNIFARTDKSTQKRFAMTISFSRLIR